MPALPTSETYFHLKGADAEVIPLTEEFWPQVISGERVLDGWLMSVISMNESPGHWEMHPNGDELLAAISGRVDIILEVDGEEEVIKLSPGLSCKVPRGVWHRQVVHEPTRLLFCTFGQGTEHRPV